MIIQRVKSRFCQIKDNNEYETEWTQSQ